MLDTLPDLLVERQAIKGGKTWLARTPNPSQPKIGGFIGLGEKPADGHKRITQTDETVVVGGSAESHERMTETAIRISEELEHRGKTIGECGPREAHDILRKALDKTGR